MRLLNADIFGRKCCETVTANSGKLRSFVLCSVKRSMNEKEALLHQRSAIFALLPQQGRNEVTWCPGEEAGLVSLCSNLRFFRCKDLYCIENVLYWRMYFWHCWDFKAAPYWFGARELFPPFPPSLRPCEARGHFRYGVERAKRFVNVHFIASNMERISKISSLLHPLEKVSVDARASYLDFSKFWHFSDMFWLFLTCKYSKQKYLNYRNFAKPFICNIRSLETWNLQDRELQPSRPRTVTFETETRKNGSRDASRDYITAGFNHRSYRNLAMYLTKKWPHRLLLLPKWQSDSGSGSGFSQIFDSGSERKTQNLFGVDSGTPDLVPPLVVYHDCKVYTENLHQSWSSLKQKCWLIFVQTKWVCPSEIQSFCRNDSHSSIESLLVTQTESFC